MDKQKFEKLISSGKIIPYRGLFIDQYVNGHYVNADVYDGSGKMIPLTSVCGEHENGYRTGYGLSMASIKAKIRHYLRR